MAVLVGNLSHVMGHIPNQHFSFTTTSGCFKGCKYAQTRHFDSGCVDAPHFYFTFTFWCLQQNVFVTHFFHALLQLIMKIGTKNKVIEKDLEGQENKIKKEK